MIRIQEVNIIIPWKRFLLKSGLAVCECACVRVRWGGCGPNKNEVEVVRKKKISGAKNFLP